MESFRVYLSKCTTVADIIKESDVVMVEVIAYVISLDYAYRSCRRNVRMSYLESLPTSPKTTANLEYENISN